MLNCSDTFFSSFRPFIIFNRVPILLTTSAARYDASEHRPGSPTHSEADPPAANSELLLGSGSVAVAPCNSSACDGAHVSVLLCAVHVRVLLCSAHVRVLLCRAHVSVLLCSAHVSVLLCSAHVSVLLCSAHVSVCCCVAPMLACCCAL